MGDLKERLLSRHIPEGDVELVVDGEVVTVRVRGLSRGEVFLVQTISDKEANDRAIVARGMVDPPMNDADVKQWQRSSPAGEIELVVAKIQELSGLAEGADKSGLQGVRDEPGDGVRVLPGDEAGDDGS